MKDIWKNGVAILLIIAVSYIIFLRECKRPELCPPKGEILIAQQTWDSIQALADKLPVITIDTCWLPGDTVYLPSVPLPVPKPDTDDRTINNYADSLVNKEIKVWVDYKIQGVLLNREWRYVPITTQITVEKLVYVPRIVLVEKPVIQAKNGLYAYGITGGNKDSFLFGGGLDLITKKETMIGYQYQRFGDVNFHNIKIGARLGGKR